MFSNNNNQKKKLKNEQNDNIIYKAPILNSKIKFDSCYFDIKILELFISNRICINCHKFESNEILFYLNEPLTPLIPKIIPKLKNQKFSIHIIIMAPFFVLFFL